MQLLSAPSKIYIHVDTITTRHMKQIKKYLPLILAGIFVVALCFQPVLIYFTGFFAMAILISSLKQLEATKVLIILSPIVTYPLFLMLTGSFTDGNDILNLQFHWLKNLTIYIILYTLISGLIFQNLWSWIAANKRKISILALTLMAAVTLFYGPLALECHFTSNAEKGVSQEDISRCDLFNLYNPTGVSHSGTFSGVPYAMIKIATLGVGLTLIVVILTLIFFEAKYYIKTKVN